MATRENLPPVHPGEILLTQFLEPRELSQYQLARSIAVPARRINEIVHGQRRISADTALRLARFFGTSRQFWMNLQSRYDLQIAQDQLGSALDVIRPITEVHPEDTRVSAHRLINEGLFWSVGGRVQARGEFVAEPGRNALVTLSAAVVEDPRIAVTEHTATSVSVINLLGDPTTEVAAFAPTDLHGELNSGERVSLLYAQNYGLPGIPATTLPPSMPRLMRGMLGTPRYIARFAVIGAHVPATQLYSAVRFRVDHPHWTSHLADGEVRAVANDGSVLRAAASEDRTDTGTWLVYESARPRSLQELDSRVLAACLTLAGLALDRRLMLRAVQVRIDHDGKWLPVHSKAYSTEVSRSAEPLPLDEPLLSHRELTIERFANWIALNDRLEGLASAVCELGTGPLQLQVLIATTLVEGLHRRLPRYQGSQLEFVAPSVSALDRIKKAASAAAEDAAAERGMDCPGRVRAAVGNAVSHVDEVSYRIRARAITSDVTSAVPELSEAIPDLAGKLASARNELAHHPSPYNKTESLVTRLDRWSVIQQVAPWLLRLLLLLEAGIDPDALHRACLDSRRFSYARANIAAIARDLGWPSAADLHGRLPAMPFRSA